MHLYVHFPFCLSKCPYCDFNSHVVPEIDHKSWVQGILHELKRNGYTRFSTIFFGGGTPSLADPKCIEMIIDAVDCSGEITLEANPNSAEVQKLKDFRMAGVNRISVGIQSIIPEDLKFLGRTHSAQEAFSAMDNAVSVFDRASFDLIYARPEQTLEAWTEELTTVLRWKTEHLSLYQLTIEPNTAFYHAKVQIPDTHKAAAFYERTYQIMMEHNRPPYEVSNYGTPCEHNLGYWRYRDYLGVGPGAHSRLHIDGVRYHIEQVRAPSLWLEQIAQQGHGNKRMEALRPEDEETERIMMGMRLFEGIELPENIPAERWTPLVDAGWVLIERGRVRATQEGMLRLNALLGYVLA